MSPKIFWCLCEVKVWWKSHLRQKYGIWLEKAESLYEKSFGKMKGREGSILVGDCKVRTSIIKNEYWRKDRVETKVSSIGCPSQYRVQERGISSKNPPADACAWGRCLSVPTETSAAESQCISAEAARTHGPDVWQTNESEEEEEEEEGAMITQPDRPTSTGELHVGLI